MNIEDIIRLLARLEQQADSDVTDATTRHSHGGLHHPPHWEH